MVGAEVEECSGIDLHALSAASPPAAEGVRFDKAESATLNGLITRDNIRRQKRFRGRMLLLSAPGL